MEDNLLFSLLAGMLGGKITRYVLDNNRKIRIPFMLLYAVCFTLVYSSALIFLAILYWMNGTEISWKGVGIFSISVSFCIVLALFVWDKIKQRK